ncbi:hypothetical protein [Gracilibacillus alcaliphilus]|uniref:hypothetical protein n=1 Tax=Gracilibacillus alcaliphilus TaxID=1401441 RepID=UPI00195754CD|nr:hypothetical protein [Gracilibacillus alcaliphilus]MBM7678774.1 cytochrome bd-type quinol oxidase subunit 1 [Gracilibacillus alcaliphilus]
MKKIIFEQVGNIILVLLLMVAMVQSVYSAHIEVNSPSISFELGLFWLLFLIWMVIFIMFRFLYGKKNKAYDTKKGEFSAEDEREELISKKATVITYKMMITLLIILLFLCFGLSLLLADIKLFQTIIIVAIGISLIVGFITYLLAWIRFDITI